jgi:hypothetical protein
VRRDHLTNTTLSTATDEQGHETGAVLRERDALERERLRIQAEIVSYPTPIPACDVYFNGLLEQRARICEALARLDAAGAGKTV